MKFSGWFVATCLIFSIACSQPITVEDNNPRPETDIPPTPERTMPPIPIHISGLSSSQLCNRLASIDTLPTRDPTITDPIYESLIVKGDDAIPCLVAKISDKTPVPDPRYSVPHWQHYAVGDTAVFVLLDILSTDDLQWEKLMIEMLPPKSQEEWKTNGVYAYFDYVSEPRNRKELQRRWLQWMKQHRKDLFAEIGIE